MSALAYYNEIDPHAAQWLRNLIEADHIAPGTVDTRSVVDVRPADLAGYAQCHLFAGIAGWSLALRLAGVPDDLPVWTGSCPCQPFSAAGRRRGFADDRHLWPVWFELIRECRPVLLFGEQVASKDGLGWLDAVLADLEGAGYACRAADLCAAGVGAPHIRQRLWFVAYAAAPRQRNAEDAGADQGCAGALQGGGQGQPWLREPQRSGSAIRLGNAHGIREAAIRTLSGRSPTEREGGFWSSAEWLPCRDGKFRPVEPGTFPLASGLPGRVGRLRAYGNAIVPQVAAAFISASLDALNAAHRPARPAAAAPLFAAE